MMQVFRFDSDGFFIEPVIINDQDEIPFDCTEIQPMDGLYKAKFVDGKWVESLTDDEINSIKNTPNQLTETEQLRKQQTDLVYQLMLNEVL